MITVCDVPVSTENPGQMNDCISPEPGFLPIFEIVSLLNKLFTDRSP